MTFFVKASFCAFRLDESKFVMDTLKFTRLCPLKLKLLNILHVSTSIKTGKQIDEMQNQTRKQKQYSIFFSGFFFVFVLFFFCFKHENSECSKAAT